jgi:hypothetical protein
VEAELGQDGEVERFSTEAQNVPHFKVGAFNEKEDK